jgi:hypothetical protein
MKTSNRTLLGFGIGILALVVLTVVLVLTLGQSDTVLLDENTPEGVVQRYLLAVQERNYPLAYGYLTAPDITDPRIYKEPLSSYSEWFQSVQFSSDTTWKARLGKINITGNTASVDVLVDTFHPGGPFDDPVRTNTNTFTLKKVGADWRITSPFSLYWLYY